MSNQASNDPTRCPICGNSNQCALANPATATRPCWCFSVTISPPALTNPLAADNPNACLCPTCALAQLVPDPNAP